MINYRDVLKIAGILGFFLIFAMMCLIAIQAGWLGPKDESFYHGRSQFEISVGKGGDSVYTGLAAVSEEVREEVEGVVYESPEAATDATSHSLAGNVALAHAARVCTHSKSGVVSNNTGGGRHLTWFQGHWSGAHHTRTVHQTLTQSGWVTYATYDYAVARSYCNC